MGPTKHYPLAVHDFTYHTQYVVSVNPVMEQPKLDQTSLRQPISVAGWGRYVRTHMSGPILGRWGDPHAPLSGMSRVAHVGKMVGHTSERDRMRGVLNRGYTYQYPPSSSEPGPGRVQQIGQGGTGGRGRRG